jgi:cell division transport system permease protein
MTVDALRAFLRQAAATLWLNRRLYAGSVLALGLVLALVGGALVGRANLAAVAALARSRAEITAYLRPSTPPAAVAAAEANLDRVPGVTAVRYVDAGTALVQMRAVLGPDAPILRQLDGQNPFDPYLAVTVRPDRGPAVAEAARRRSGVEWVQDSAPVLRRLQALIRVAQGAGWALIAAALAVATVVVAHVTRLSLWARRHEMATLRWLGAGPLFVALPFLLESLLLGSIGGLVAGALLLGAGAALGTTLSQLLPFLPWQFGAGVLIRAAGATVGIGLGCALLGALAAVRPWADRPDAA